MKRDRQKSHKDERVTVNSVSLRNYFFLFFCMLLLCGSYTGLYFLQNDTGGQNQLNAFYTALSMATYLAVESAIMIFLLSCFRRKYIQRPIDRLQEAARKVANGDYTVRLSPMRKDGEKDEFEVLFEDFNTMTEELASTEMLKNDFISNVSHELKTPLAVMQNYATILQSGNLTEEEKKEYAGKIADASKRLSVLVTNILQLSRLENQKIVTHNSDFNLSEQLSRCALGFEEIWEEKELEIETDMDQNIILNSDEELLDIVWNNLLSNALKFTEKGGTIRITAKKDEKWAVITVEDNGCGMNAEAQKHIFDKFYQADTSHATVGNGLGLALVRQIITLLKGEIAVESAPGIGTEFEVRLRI